MATIYGGKGHKRCGIATSGMDIYGWKWQFRAVLAICGGQPANRLSSYMAAFMRISRESGTGQGRDIVFVLLGPVAPTRLK